MCAQHRIQIANMFWGITPSLNLLEEYKRVTDQEIPKEINILIVGSSDCRHILSTIATQYEHEEVTVNFFIIETCVELIARQLLLLNIALQADETLGLDQKTKIFMEIYGNTLLRPSVARYLSSAASELLKMTTNYEYLQQMMPFTRLHIKYKERDYLENIFKFWYGKEEFDILKYWDKRLRKYLGVRYDSQIGAFDWDLHMRLRGIGGQQICSQEYRNFRMKGLAFSWMESEVSKPNRSLVCAILPNGNKFAHYGYLGDIETGPFTAFGLDCEDENYLKSTHGQNAYRATDVFERNLKQRFYQIHNKKDYLHKTSKVQLGALVLKEENLVVDNCGMDLLPGTVKKCIDLKNVLINFHSISFLSAMIYKDSCDKFFHLIYCSNTFVKYLDSKLMEKIFKERSVLLIENELFVLANRKKELDEYEMKIYEKLNGLQYEMKEFHSEKDFYLKFLINNKQK